jgi:ferredoxin-NADP reductase
MARAAVLGRLTWRVATVTAVRAETATARTLVLDIPGWTAHLPGQHLDVRLTAGDGYSTQRSYSIASAGPGAVELTVAVVDGGEVSSYLAEVAQAGDQFELRGPVGGYFVWRDTDPDPVLLVAGGSGIVPLMAMIRHRAGVGSRAPFRLVYSVRSPADAIFAAELARRARDDHGLDVSYVYTRSAPAGWRAPPARIGAPALTDGGWPPGLTPMCFVCGPTGFVEAVAGLLVDAGHSAGRIRTERFGGPG